MDRFRDGRVRLYTAQSPAVVEALLRAGVCYSSEALVRAKYGPVADGFLAAYSWLAGQMEKRVPKPAGAGLPYWAFRDLYSLETSGDLKVLELAVPAEEALLFDLYDWNRVLSLRYLGDDPAEARAFEKDLAAKGLNGPKVMLSSFYPAEKAAILRSWDALLDRPEPAAVQAALWCLRTDWVVDIK